MQDRDRSIYRHGGGRKVLEDIGVIKTVGVVEKWRFSRGSGESKSCSVLGDTIDCSVMGEVDIQGEGFRS